MIRSITSIGLLMIAVAGYKCEPDGKEVYLNNTDLNFITTRAYMNNFEAGRHTQSDVANSSVQSVRQHFQ